MSRLSIDEKLATDMTMDESGVRSVGPFGRGNHGGINVGIGAASYQSGVTAGNAGFDCGPGPTRLSKGQIGTESPDRTGIAIEDKQIDSLSYASPSQQRVADINTSFSREFNLSVRADDNQHINQTLNKSMSNDRGLCGPLTNNSRTLENMTVIPLHKESFDEQIVDEPDLGTIGVARTPGDTLRETRRLHNLSIEDVAADLNLKRVVVQSLEQDSADGIPSTTYARGYLRTYARYLRIPDATVAEWFEDSMQEVAEEPSKITNTRKSAIRARRTPGFAFVVFAILATTIGSAAYFGYQNDWLSLAVPNGQIAKDNSVRLGPDGDRPPTDDTGVASNAAPTLRANDSEEISFGAASNNQATLPSAPVDTSQPEVVGGGESTEVAGAVVANTVAPEVMPEESQPSSTVVDATAAVSVQGGANVVNVDGVEVELAESYRPISTGVATKVGTIALTGKSDSWVEVTDAAGQKIFLDMVHRDESHSVSGEPPFRVVVGNAPGVGIAYEGHEIDVVGNANENNIARLLIGE